MSGFRDDLGAARQRQDDLERENAALKEELAKERARPALAPPPIPRAILLALAGTVVASGLVAYCVAYRSGTDVKATVPPPPPPPAIETAPAASTVSFAQPQTRPTEDAWISVPVPVKVPLHAIADGLDVLYAVGDGGTILRRHKAEDVWTAETSGTTKNLRSVSVQGGRVAAVGDGGAAVALDKPEATAFHALASGTTKNLHAVHFSSLGLIAVGDDGTMLRDLSNDDVLVPIKSPTTKHLRAICAALPDVWIAGDAGTLIHMTLTDIEAVDSGTTENLYAVACDGAKVIAVGARGVVTQRTDPRAKFAVTHDGDADYLAITSYYGSSTWLAVGRGGVTSASFSSKRGGLRGDLEGVVYSTLGTWAVGAEGIFFAR